MIDLLLRVQRLEQAADDFGFSWENPHQIMAQILSECEEIQAHLQTGHVGANPYELQEEIGDLLHAAFSLCVFCQFNPKKTLEKTLNKFEKRLMRVKQLANNQGLQDLKGQSFDKLMKFWSQAKQLESAESRVQYERIELSDAQHHSFRLDKGLESSCFYLLDWPLSRVLLKNNACYPWLILVPRQTNLREITELSKLDRSQLMEELYQATYVMQEMFKPDKINMGALGNIVPQLHFHVIARFHDDPLWPQGVWQTNGAEEPYIDQDSLIFDWVSKLSSVVF